MHGAPDASAATLHGGLERIRWAAPATTSAARVPVVIPRHFSRSAPPPPVAHVLRMTTLELRDPVHFLIAVEARDLPVDDGPPASDHRIPRAAAVRVRATEPASGVTKALPRTRFATMSHSGRRKRSKHNGALP